MDKRPGTTDSAFSPPFCFKGCLELSAYWFLFFKWKAIKCPTHYPFKHIDYCHCFWLLVCSFNGMKMRTRMKWKCGGGCTRTLTPDFLIPFGNYANTAVYFPEMWTPQWSRIEPTPMIWDLSSLNPGNRRFNHLLQSWLDLLSLTLLLQLSWVLCKLIIKRLYTQFEPLSPCGNCKWIYSWLPVYKGQMSYF